MEFRRANGLDLDNLLRLQADFYAEERYVHRTPAAREAWTTLLNTSDLGEVWVAETSGAIVAYVVVTFSFSLEFLGRDAFVDELFVAPAHRGRGVGRMGLAAAEAVCLRAGVRALHLEMEHDNDVASQLYRRWGFIDHNRALMTKWLVST